MIACVFPGQGSQTVGMGKALADQFEICATTFAEADAALSEPLSDLIFNGPADRLTGRVTRDRISSSTITGSSLRRILIPLKIWNSWELKKESA